MAKKQVDVLFIPAPLQFKKGKDFVPKGDETSTPPLGIMYIATFLNSRGYRCQILEVGLKRMSLSETIREIKKINPRMVGISILTPSVITAVPLAREIKKRLPHILIGCGGVHVCVDPTFIKRYPVFDFGVKGEGEEIMLEIMKKLDAGKKISGVYNGGYVKDIDNLPFPDYRLLDFKLYGDPTERPDKRKGTITMMTSRGCPYNCSFCCKTESRKYIRYRSAQKIVDEIELNYPSSCGVYNFVDDTMTFNQKITREICEEIIKRKLKISWLAMTRADCFDLSLAKLMKRSGCRELFLGVESGDERIRNKVLKKRISDQAIFKGIDVCRQAGIRTSIFLMLGFPSEGKKEVEKTVEYPFLSKADMAGVHLTFPLPGSELWLKAIEEKIIPPDLIDRFIKGEYGNDFSGWPKFVNQEISLDYLEKARSRSLRKFYLSPSFFWRLLIYYLRFPSRIKYDKYLYKNALRFLLSGRSLVQFS